MAEAAVTTGPTPAGSARRPKRRADGAERQKRFRKEFVEATPKWYRGELHLAFMLTVTLGTIAFCAFKIHNPTVWEWLLLVPVALFGNWVEWAAHRYLLHRPVPGLRAVYKRHCAVHHQFFTDHDLTYHGQKEWRALLFPPFAPVGFVVVSIPPAVIVGLLWSANAGYIIVAAMAGYYLMYEALHTLSHLDYQRHPWVRHVPLLNTIPRMHRVHHELDMMQTHNFNLTFPLCDALFGTSDLKRGVIGTLFNGFSEKYADKSVKKTPPPKEFYPEH